MYYISETAEVWINFILLFCSTWRLSSNSGQKNIYLYIYFVFKVAYFDPAWDARKKRRIIYFWGVTRKKNFCGKENALLKHFFKDFLAQNGFHMTSNIKTSNHHRAIFWWNYVHDFYLLKSYFFEKWQPTHRFLICGWPTFEFKNADSDY